IGSAYTTNPKKDIHFDLRFWGQSIATVIVPKNSKSNNKLIIDKKKFVTRNNKEKFKGVLDLDIFKNECNEYSWAGNNLVQQFKQFFKSYTGEAGQEEHKCENLLLKELYKSGKTSKLRNIQPITIDKGESKIFFQMQTPISASKDDISYSTKGGGVDIMARYGKGVNMKLIIFELKDTYTQFGGKDDEEDVIKQAIAYATFIARLCETDYANDVWNLFGFEENSPRGKIIAASSLLPDPQNDIFPSYCGSIINVPNSDYKIELNCTYFDKSTFKITRSSLNSKP
ncbi:MAG: hypothetical protein II670_02490, partial [Alphaproteobacteria bacterium]|nr:hypothetical protein [Alphaproteobacteria bacterium]